MSHRPVEALLRSGGVRTVFQPVVDLDTDDVVAHEALARGPRGSRGPTGEDLVDPLALFAAARREGLLAELDQACRTIAVRAASAQRSRTSTIFLNAEPEAFTATAGTTAWEALGELIGSLDPHLHVVLEITERDIPTRPATLLRTVERIRQLGWGIALDDVGVSTASLAFMPLLRPDVVKLDATLVQEPLTAATAEIMHAVNAYAERSGALVLAEGIETPRHLRTARALGARLGQGWLFGHPEAELAATSGRGAAAGDGEDGVQDVLTQRAVAERARTTAAPVPAGSTPFATLPADVVPRRASKALLQHLSTQLEEQAVRLGQTCILTSAFQHARHFTPTTARRYEQVARHAGYVYAVGEAFTDVAVTGVHADSLPADDPLRFEWDVAVLGPHFHAALLARDLGSDGPDPERMFEYVLTYRYDTVVTAVQDLLLRVAEHRPEPLTGVVAPPRGSAVQPTVA